MSKRRITTDYSNVKSIRSFIRNDEGKPVGYIVAVLNEKENTYNVDYSSVNPQDVFNKDLAVHIAFERALNPRKKIKPIRENIFPFFEKMVYRASKYFKNSNPHQRISLYVSCTN